MKIALLADTHAGARNDSPHFDAHFRTFFEKVFFPYIDEYQIDTIIHLGDIFDRRKYINFQTLWSVRQYFFDQIAKRRISMYVVVGNHDTFFKNTNDVNSLDLLLADYKDWVGIVTNTPARIVLGGRDIVLVPWINTENYDVCVERLRRGGDICIGHFEFAGYQMFKGIPNTDGMSRALVKDFKWVFSGHFHTRSAEDNVYYLGSPYEYIWSDYDDPRGFHIFDTETDELTFVENPNRMFHKIYYDDRDSLPTPERFRGCCVNVIVVNKDDPAKFEKFIEELNQQDLCELNIHEDFSEFHGVHVDDKDLNLEDTVSLLDNFVDATETDRDRHRLKTLLKSIYVEAQDVEL